MINLFTTSIRFLVKNKSLIVFSFLIFLLDKIELPRSSTLLLFLRMLVSLVNAFPYALLELFAALLVFREKKVFDNTPTAELFRRYVFRVIGFDLTSTFIVAMVFSPFCLVVYILLYVDNNYFSKLLLVVLIVTFSLISISVQSLGMRVLIFKNNSILWSMKTGFRLFLQNLVYFVSILIIINSVPQLLGFSFLLIGVERAGIDIISSPFVPISGFLMAWIDIYNTVRFEWSFLGILNVFLLPLGFVVISFAYLDLNTLVENTSSNP